MECVILIRLNTGPVIALQDDDDSGHLAVFKNIDEAIECADKHVLCQAMLYQIVELDEL